jgi:peptidoglycan hydrolase CwlO-like protein
MPNDAFRIPEAKDFLNRLVPVVQAYDLELNIARQEEVVKKGERKLSELQEEQKDLENKIRDLQDKIVQSKKDQELIHAELTKERTVRDALMSRRIVSK